MKILLVAINAKYIHSNLAVHSLHAYAGEYGKYIEIVEFTINNRPDEILEQIYKRQPDVLCFSCYIWNMDFVERIAREFCKLCPKASIWAGGPEVSYEVENFLQGHPEFTGVMIGEGEETFRELCCYYVREIADDTEGRAVGKESARKSLGEIAGIAFRGAAGDVFRTSSREPLDLSSVPFCYDNVEDFSNRIIYYESSRGCPFSCSYCLSSLDKKLRFRNLDLVKKELAFFMEQKVPQVKFVDRTFNCNRRHAMEIWRFIQERDNGITNFHFEVAADLLDEEELELFSRMRPGLIQLEIGVQSTHEATLSEIRRSMDLGRVKGVAERLEAFGNIHIHLDLIAGLPYEDYDTFQKSFDEIYALKPNQLQLGFLKVLKGSYLYEQSETYGLKYHSDPPYEVLYTRWLPYEKILCIKQAEEMLETYYNSGQYEVTMKVLEVLFESPFLMYQKLGDFYEKKGYFGMSHSRIRRCEILLEFVEESVAKEREEGHEPILNCGKDEVLPCVREALVFDLYYRENCKSRPTWAPEESAWRELSRKYASRGRLTHLEQFHYRFPGAEVKTISTLPEYEEKPLWALFSYDHRNPLNHQAQVEWIDSNLLQSL